MEHTVWFFFFCFKSVASLSLFIRLRKKTKPLWLFSLLFFRCCGAQRFVFFFASSLLPLSLSLCSFVCVKTKTFCCFHFFFLLLWGTHFLLQSITSLSLSLCSFICVKTKTLWLCSFLYFFVLVIFFFTRGQRQ